MAMASIRIISTSSVSAANHKEPNPRIELAVWDIRLIQIDAIQNGLLFRKPPKEKEAISSLIHHLKTSLSRTLDFFPPLAGRLATIDHGRDNTISYFIDCNNAGAEFVHAALDGVSIADIIEPVYVPKIVYSFFPLNGFKNHQGISKPLLAVQVSELVDGFFIGCTMNHSVGDGTSFWHFFNSWSEISRGFDCISNLPVLQRWFLHDTDCPIRIPLLIKEQTSDTFIPPPLQERVFHFTKESISKLKAKANAEIGTNKISSLQALLSHFWRSAIRNKSLDPDQDVSFRLPVGVRPRLQPPLPPEYFGNAIQGEPLALKARDQLEGVGYVALQINKIVDMHTDEKIKKFLESWRKNPSLVSVERGMSNVFLMSSSPRFNVYGNDFGWGKPIAVRSGPANKIDGKITLYPGAEEGSIDIEACLLPETLQAMGNDAEFMGAVTTS